MKRLLNNIMDLLASAAMLETGDHAQGLRSIVLPMHKCRLCEAETFFRCFSIAVADVTLLEIGVFTGKPDRKP